MLPRDNVSGELEEKRASKLKKFLKYQGKTCEEEELSKQTKESFLILLVKKDSYLYLQASFKLTVSKPPSRVSIKPNTKGREEALDLK